VNGAGRVPGVRDARQRDAADALRAHFDQYREDVFFARQVQVLFEDQWFHWVTGRALNDLIGRGEISDEVRTMSTGQPIHLLWHPKYRYYRRKADQLVRLVEEYSDPSVGGAIGLNGEALLLEGFAKRRFLMAGRNTRTYEGRTWTDTAHDLDFIFERDGAAYGVEVKNTLGYMEHKEL
jgi:hypothetical protein